MKQKYTIVGVFFALALLSDLVAIISVSLPTGTGYNIPIVSTLLVLIVSGLLDRAFIALGALSLVITLVSKRQE